MKNEVLDSSLIYQLTCFLESVRNLPELKISNSRAFITFEIRGTSALLPFSSIAYYDWPRVPRQNSNRCLNEPLLFDLIVLFTSIL